MFRLLVALALLSPAALAQGALVTDRPDFTESAVVVPHRSVQIETGATATWADTEAAPVLSGPETLVRLGALPRVEVRLGLPDYVWTDGPDGFADPSVGLKAELGRLGAWDVAAIVETSLPLGESPFGDAPASPLALLIVGRDLGELSVGAQAEVAWDRALDRVDGGGTAVLGVPLTNAAGVFFEVAGGSGTDGTDVVGHLGATLLLSPTVQLDARLGAGLTEAAPDVFAGVGASARF